MTELKISKYESGHENHIQSGKMNRHLKINRALGNYEMLKTKLSVPQVSGRRPLLLVSLPGPMWQGADAQSN